MRIAHAFWSKPIKNKMFTDKDDYKQLMLSFFAYSIICVKRNGYEIDLYTDKDGKDFLGFLPYDNIYIIDGYDDEPTNFAACFKFEAMKRMQLGDCMIDGDCFLEHKRTFEYIETFDCDLLCGFFESYKHNYRYEEETQAFSKLNEKFRNIDLLGGYSLPYIPYGLNWSNCCFTRFMNQEFKDAYIKQYDEHRKLLKSVEFTGNLWPDLYIEQHFLGCLAVNKGYNIKYILNDFNDPKEVDQKGFIHIGGQKYKFRDTMKVLIFNNNPEIYKKVFGDEPVKIEEKKEEEVKENTTTTKAPKKRKSSKKK